MFVQLDHVEFVQLDHECWCRACTTRSYIHQHTFICHHVYIIQLIHIKGWLVTCLFNIYLSNMTFDNAWLIQLWWMTSATHCCESGFTTVYFYCFDHRKFVSFSALFGNNLWLCFAYTVIVLFVGFSLQMITNFNTYILELTMHSTFCIYNGETDVLFKLWCVDADVLRRKQLPGYLTLYVQSCVSEDWDFFHSLPCSHCHIFFWLSIYKIVALSISHWFSRW